MLINNFTSNTALYFIPIRYDKLKEEKEEIEEAFIEYRREIERTSKADITKEIKVLKKIIKNLEQELLKEKSKHHHSSNKKSKEYRNLLEEVYTYCILMYCNSFG